MVLKNVCFVLIFLILFSGCSFDDEYFKELEGVEDYDNLIKTMSGEDLVFLGESTHGTQEYYEIRSKISKRLIEEYDFDFIVVEGDWASLYELNLYVKGKSSYGSAREILEGFDRWPEWMWSNEVIEDLAEWLKDYNEDLPVEERVGFYGMDVYGGENSLEIVEELTEYSYDCMVDFVDDFSLYSQYLAQGNPSCHREVEEIYESISDDEELMRNLGERKYFYVKQNAFIVKNAERHHRGMVFDFLSSWNERVYHMEDTLYNLLDYKGDKGILWAHNTHVGDARFTSMREEGRVNIGELAREEGKDVFILGFATSSGEVIAGSSWGSNENVMQIPPANENSYEYFFMNEGLDKSLIMFDDSNIPEELKEVNNNRAIGVVYNPYTEYPSNYVPTDITNRYDGLIFINQTTPLESLS